MTDPIPPLKPSYPPTGFEQPSVSETALDLDTMLIALAISLPLTLLAIAWTHYGPRIQLWLNYRRRVRRMSPEARKAWKKLDRHIRKNGWAPLSTFRTADEQAHWHRHYRSEALGQSTHPKGHAIDIQLPTKEDNL